eukprot:4680384-Pyramimonas_sp.AAC.1
MRRSRMRLEAPYAIKQSRSISPRRRPPSRDLPSVGCKVPPPPPTVPSASASLSVGRRYHMGSRGDLSVKSRRP